MKMVGFEVLENAELESIGVEFECGYDKLSLETKNKINDLVFGFEIGSDASVRVEDRDHIGSEFRFWHYNIENLTKAVEILMTEAKAKQNFTCANHRHVKFKHANKILNEHLKLKKSLLRFRDSYLKTFQDELYIARLNNYYSRNSIEWELSEEAYRLAEKYFYDRRYCRYHDKEYEKKEFTKQYFEKDRYYFVNFCSFRKLFTTEFRVYPCVFTAEEFDKQSKHLNNFVNSFKPVYKIYHIYDENIDMYISRVNRKYLCIEVKHNRYAERLSRKLDFSYRESLVTDTYDFAYADRQSKKTRLSEYDRVFSPILLNNQLNYYIFRIIKGYVKIPVTEIGEYSVKEFANRVYSEFENFKDVIRSRYNIQ